MADISKIQIESGTYNIKDEQARSDIETLNNYYNLQTNRKIIFIGDSYLEGYSPDGNTTSFGSLVAGKLNATYQEKFLGGVGFSATINSRNFITLLDEISADETVTDIIVAGGYNDRVAISGIWQGIANFKTLANTKFPNATIHIAEIGWTTDTDNLYDITRVIEHYNYTCKELGLHYMRNCEYTLHFYGLLFASDGIHPNQMGQYRIADNLTQAFLYGGCDVIGEYHNIPYKNLNNVISNQSFLGGLATTMKNNIVEVSTSGDFTEIYFSTPQHLTGYAGFSLKLADIDIAYNDNNKYSYIIGNKYNYNVTNIPCILCYNDGTFDNYIAQIMFKSGGIYLHCPGMINDDKDNYKDKYVTQVQFTARLHTVFDTSMC